MIIFLIDQDAQAKQEKSVKRGKQVKPYGWDCRLYHYFSKVSYIQINRIAQKEALNSIGIAVNRIKYGRHIHKQQREYVPEIQDILEKDE
jgi:hypothetical protein